MLSASTLSKILASALVGSGLTYAIMSSVSQRKKVEPVSAALCFIKDNFKSELIAQVDGKLINRESVPPDLYFSHIQAEAEARARLTLLARQISARIDTSPQGAQKTGLVKPQDLKARSNFEISKNAARDYFQNNKNAFPGAPFEKVEKMISDLLQKREDEFRLKNEIDALEAQNRFHILAPLACGGKVDIPYSNDLPARGNTEAKFHILYAFSYDCQVCRNDLPEIRRFISRNQANMRFWFLPVPGQQGSTTYQFATALQCAHSIKTGDMLGLHEELLSVRRTSDGGDSGNQNISKLAEKFGYKADEFKKCIENQKTKDQIELYRGFASRFKIAGASPAYFVNGRGMETNLDKGFIHRVKFILDERERLKELL